MYQKFLNMMYLKLYGCCYVTEGALNSCIIDVDRNIYCSISKELYEIICKGYFCEKEEKYLLKDIEFLINEGFIYKTQNLENNIEELLEYNSSYEVEDLIIDTSTMRDLYYYLSRIELYKFEIVQIRCFFNVCISDIKKILNEVAKKNVSSLEIIFNRYKNDSVEDYMEIYRTNFHLSKMIIMDFYEELNYENVFFIREKLISEKQCGIIDESLFNPNIRNFIISKSCNSCLYKKISIDRKGEIKNCPSMNYSFGNIRDISIEEVIKKTEYQKYWKVNKDKISVCKDCEFRYICTDCRAYTERGLYQDEVDISKPLKCGYDPYTGNWSDWMSDPIKQKSINFYGIVK